MQVQFNEEIELKILEKNFMECFIMQTFILLKKVCSEMEKIVIFDELPDSWTYPKIQPKLIEYYINLENK